MPHSSDALPNVFMFSGQGSQYFRMGADLYRSDAFFHEQLVTLDRIVRLSIGRSVITTLYECGRSRAEPFNDVLLSSLALFMIEHALVRTLIHHGCRPDLMLTVSMGAYAAITSSDGASIDDMVNSIVAFSLALVEQCQHGGMLAVLASPSLYQVSDELMGGSEIASITSGNHFVLSMPETKRQDIERCLSRHKAPYQFLPVSRAYHSRWIDPVEDAFKGTLRSLPIAPGAVPLQLCIGHRAVSRVVPDMLWEAARGPIQFTEAISQLEASGPKRYIDAGPSGTLATLLKYVLPENSASRVHSILTPYEQADSRLQALLADCMAA